MQRHTTAALVTAIEAATNLNADYANGTLTIDGTIGIGTSINFAIISITNMAIADNGMAVAGTFECDDEGPITVPANTLTTIITPISGWGAVTNPLIGSTGRYAETDAEFRARASSLYSSGKATEAAIRQAVLNSVPGVLACSVTSNRASEIDTEGRPPHSFETLVDGGEPSAIAAAIWGSAPAGIEIYGKVSAYATDAEGTSHVVKFTRPSYAYIWVKVIRTLDPESPYPIDGDTRIKQAIVDWALSYYDARRNVYRRAILTPVNTIPGLADVSITLGNTLDGTTPTAYTSTDLPIPATSIAAFDVSRISVEAP